MNILFVPNNKKEICHAFVSKYNHKRKNQVILLMITDNCKRWHHLSVSSLSAMFRGTTSGNDCDFYCLNCFLSYCTPYKLKKTWESLQWPYYYRINMPKEGENILKYNPVDKSLKDPFIIYADLECLLKRSNFVKIIMKKDKHKSLGYSFSLIC